MSERGERGAPPPRPSLARARGGPHHVRIESAKDFRGSLARLVRYFGPQALLVGLAALGILAAAVFKTLGPALVGSAIDRHLRGAGGLPGFLRSVETILAVYGAAWAADLAAGVLLVRVGNAVAFRMREEAFDKIQGLPLSYFDARGVGDLISRLTNDIEVIYNALSQSFSGLVGGAFAMIGVLVAMTALNAPLALFMLVSVPVMAAASIAVGKRVRAAFRANQDSVGKLSAAIEESTAALRVTQAFRKETGEVEKFGKVNRAARDAGIEADTAASFMAPLMQVLTGVSLAAVTGIGGVLAASGRGDFTVGLLAAFIMYARRFFEPLMQLTNVYNVLQSAMAGAERVFEVLDEPGEARGAGGESPARLDGDVEFRGLGFGYGPGKPVLESISFRAERGSTVAIVGPTGAGKTTLVNLLSRFYEPDSGSIEIGGKDIRGFDIDHLRRRMGVVLQEPFFFSMSVRDNLAYARPGATEQEVLAAARRAGADHFISRLPEGLDTVLSERGANLSQGERQLLAIARAILADPDILVLDEATSSVDSLTESRIQSGLAELMRGRTSFVIAHRLSTIRDADKVVVMHARRIVEEGTHAELVARDGLYARLWRMQKTMDEVTEEGVAT